MLSEGRADEHVRRQLAECDVHTLLRLPTGIFYGGRGQGEKVIAGEIVEELQAALVEFSAVAEALQKAKAEREGTVPDEGGRV